MEERNEEENGEKMRRENVYLELEAIVGVVVVEGSVERVLLRDRILRGFC